MSALELQYTSFGKTPAFLSKNDRSSQRGMCQINEIQFGIYVEIGTKYEPPLPGDATEKKIFTKDKRQHLTLKSLRKEFPSKQE